MKYLPLEKLVKQKNSEALLLKRLFPFLAEYFSDQGISENLREKLAFIVLKKAFLVKSEIGRAHV